MRTLSVLAIVVLAGACSSENELRFTSTLENQTRGVALTEDGLDAHAGMVGTTCTIDTNWGCPTADANLPSDEEVVLDHFGGDTLGSSPDGVHIIRAAAWQSDLDVSVPSVRAAVLRNDGPLMVAGDAAGCQLHDGLNAISVPAEACADDADYAFDRVSGSAFVAANDQVFHVAMDQSTAIADHGDLVAYDTANDLVIVATNGGSTLEALRTNGAVVWSLQTEGPISSIAARGSLGQLLVMVTDEIGYGSMQRLDGATGAELNTYRLPDPVCDLVVSENGRTVGCVRNDEVNFYEIEVDLEAPVIDLNPPANCIDPINRMTMD